MIAKKRILVTLLVSVMFTFLFSASAFAAETDADAAATVQESNTVDNNTNNSDTAELSTTTVDNTADLDESITDMSNLQQTADGNYIDENGQIYVVDYVDEQGQIYYKKAEEPETEITAADTEEEVQEDEAAKTQEDQKDEADKKPSYSEQDLRLLACLVYSEAGNQSYNGMLGVANVVLNRTHSDAYYYIHTVKQAIYDKKWSVQFAVTNKNSSGVSMLDKALKIYDTGKYTGSNPAAEKAAMQKAIKAAKAALEGKNNIGTFLCFQNVRSAKSIKKHYSDYKIIGAHIFYRAK
jgi:spore germination cell wall hydrolase CwlJ-like protein